MNDRERLERKRLHMERQIQKAVVDFERFSGLRVTSVRMSENSRRTVTTAAMPENDGIPVLTDEVTI